jgi:DedD protein
MGLLSFLKRKSSDSNGLPPAPELVDSVQQARVRARQRLVGALVLVVFGVVGFSLLFDTQPRPISADIPIDIARKDAMPPGRPAVNGVVRPAPRTARAADEVPAPVESAPEPAPSVVAVAPVAVEAPAPTPTLEKKPDPKPAEPKPESKPTAAKPVDSSRAQALLEGKPAAASGRFVVQVGAFAETSAASEARKKVERLGLKTFTQVVNTTAGNRVRVRVGPFASRDEADRAAGKIKSAGLPSAIVPL